MTIKSKYRIKNNDGIYETVHLETTADQVLTTDNRQFVSSQEKNAWNEKANANHTHNEYALKNGSALQDFNAKQIIVNDSILPAKDGLNIGSETQRFSGIYVDEAYLSTNTLYIGDTPILGTNQDTIMIKADPDQSITMQTKNSGTTKILSETGVELAADGTNTNVNIKATGANSQVNIAAANVMNLSAADIKMNADVNITGSTTANDLTVKGNLNVLGTTTTIDTQTLQVKDNIIDINKGETGSGVTAGKAGIRVLRGDSPNYNILFDETDDMFKVGMDNQLETIATRPYLNQELEKKANTVHNHQASQVTFTDGKTFQQKLDEGSLKGPKGDTGAQGPQGIQGVAGATGAKGDTGATWRPSVDSSGNLTWTQNSSTTAPTSVNIKGPQGATGAQGPKGDTGAQGIQGPQGPAGATPTIKAGTVTTGAAGTSASVTASTSGTTTTFNFTIPQGAKGDKGATGATGPQGAKGDTGATGPQGATGAKGATGVSMRLMGAWSSSVAYVNNSSYIDLVTANGNTYACKTSNTNQAVTNTTYWTLIAQKGDTGAKGATGATGAQGPQGPTGATGAKGADGLTTSVTVGSTKYTHVSGNITIPAYPTLSSLGAAASSHTHTTVGAYMGISNTTGTNGYGISLYGNAVAGAPSYGLMFQQTGTWGTHGSVTGDWATYFTMAGATTRGWIFKAGNSTGGNVASISATGVITATTFKGALSGNASTATKLQTARTINGTSFNGSANITTANWGTARTITIGNTGKSVNGSGNVSWSLSEIGAAAASHTHAYVPTSDYSLTTITKSLTVTTSWIDTGITGTNLATGSYIIQMIVDNGTNTSQYQEHYTGVMSWFSGTTNSTDSDEILLHKAGHASNGRMVYLRTIRTASSGYLKLQIATSTAFTAATSITFKFRKLI